MKWVPSWVAKSYARLYAEKNTNWFDFEEAKSILKIEEKKVLSLRLARLEEAGFLISKKDAVDRRKKYFRLLEPNDVIFSYGIRLLSASENIMDRLVNASKKMEFVIGDSYAAYVHSGYASPGKIDIYVNEEDKDRWIALLSDKFTSISVDDILSEKTAKMNVHIHSSLAQEMIDNSVQLDSISYVSPEALVLEGLVDQTEFSLTDTFAILIKKRREIDFKKLVTLAKGENIERELGICLEIINIESKKKIFNVDIIRSIHSSADLAMRKLFPRNKTVESEEYKELSDKWGLSVCIPRVFVSKIITDLIR